MKAKREELEGKGLSYIFGQEFLRDGTAGIEGQLIPGEWVEAAVGACEKLGIKPTGETVAALDVADGGKDRSALTIRYGVEVQVCKSRGDLLADGAGAWAYAIAAQKSCQRLLYDNIGVGAGAAASLRNKTDMKIDRKRGLIVIFLVQHANDWKFEDREHLMDAIEQTAISSYGDKIANH